MHFLLSFLHWIGGRLSMDRIQWHAHLSRTILWCPFRTNELHIPLLSKPKTAHWSAFKENYLENKIGLQYLLFYKMISKWLVIQKRNNLLKHRYCLQNLPYKISRNTSLGPSSPVLTFHWWLAAGQWTVCVPGIYRVVAAIGLVCSTSRWQGKPGSLSQAAAFSRAEAHFPQGHWVSANSIRAARHFVMCNERCHLFSFPHT